MAKPSIVVNGFINSSLSRMVKPLASFTGTTDLSKWPFCWAALPLAVISGRKASTSSREKPTNSCDQISTDALGNKTYVAAFRCRVNQQPSEPIGTRDIHSTPPATTRSSQPEATFIAARLTASRPEAQKRLICWPATPAHPILQTWPQF